MKCSLNGQHTRILAKAVNSFARIGNELYLEATQNGLTLRTVNDSETAFAVMNFETTFFTDFKIDRSNSDEFSNKCKVSMKSCLNVFKNMRQVEKCQITLNLKTSKLLFQFNCLFDTIKTHNVSILEPQTLNAVYMTTDPPNSMTAPNKMFTDIISNFRMYDNEITIEAAADSVILKNNIDMQTDKNLMRTKLALKSQEFDKYHISEPTTITFCLKELRAILNFADSLSLDLVINFETSGKPVVFAFGSVDMFTANFVMSTLRPDDFSQNTTDGNVVNQSHGHQRIDTNSRQQSDSKNLTLNLSEVIDLDVHDNVNGPTNIRNPKIAAKSLANTAKTKGNVTRANACASPPVNHVTKPLTQTEADENDPQENLLNKPQRSRSPIHQLANSEAMQKTLSEQVCATFRSENVNENANVDEEMIPQSPQPQRRRRFKMIPRLYERTQCASENRVIQVNSDDEL